MSMKDLLRRTLRKSAFGSGIWRFFHKTNIGIKRLYSDEAYFKKQYKKHSGKELDFSNPQTFDEKQLWLKMYYRNPLCVVCSDKYLVRRYVEEKGLTDILNPLIAVYDRVEDINWEVLPDRFYLKTNHGSACNIRCNHLADFDKKAAKKKLRRSLRDNYYYESREWNYRDIQRKIIVEEIIEPKEKAGLIDYRFLCYHGKCEYLFIDINTADEQGNHRHDARRNVYDRDMTLLDVTVSRPRFDPDLVQKPENFDEMRMCAEKLSGEFPFVRVDLYNVGGRILFGEMTFFHAGGFSRITPAEWAYRLGKDIDIDLAKRQMKNNYK